MADKPTLRPDLVESIKSSTAAILRMHPIEVTNPEEMGVAQRFILDVARDLKALEDHRKAEKSYFLEGGRMVDGLFNPAIRHLQDVESATKRSVIAYQRAQEAAAREAERREQEAAEARRRALLEEAERLDDEGRHGDARWARTDAHLQSAPVMPMVAPLAPGLSTRVNWRAEVTDWYALVRAAAAEPGKYAVYLQPDMAKLNALARSQGEAMQVPGVVAKAEESLTARGA